MDGPGYQPRNARYSRSGAAAAATAAAAAAC